MNADDVTKAFKPQGSLAKWRKSRTELRRLKLRDAHDRFRRQLEKAEREAGLIVIDEGEAEVKKGCDESRGLERGSGAVVGKGQSHPQQNPSSSMAAETSTPEVEWVAGRTSHAKRNSRASRKTFTH